jgi:hypothetical protein
VSGLDARLSVEAESNPDVANELISDTHVRAARSRGATPSAKVGIGPPGESE